MGTTLSLNNNSEYMFEIISAGQHDGRSVNSQRRNQAGKLRSKRPAAYGAGQPTRGIYGYMEGYKRSSLTDSSLGRENLFL